MLRKLRNDLQRRREEMYQFYYRSIGSMLKKRREDLHMTQVAVAEGLISNTYISKIENNAIAVKKEYLYLIMERMHLSIDAISFPEEMVDILEKSLSYFVRKDKEKYTALFNEIARFEYGILILISRLGYYVLIEDVESARPLYKEMFRYLTSLEEFGIMVFVIFGCWYNVGVGDYQQARTLLEEGLKISYQNNDIKSMFALLQYVIYGNLHLFTVARHGYEQAKHLFLEENNLARVVELMAYKNMFGLFNDNLPTVEFTPGELEYLSDYQRNYCLLLMAYKDDKPERFFGFFVKQAPFYAEYLYITARSYRSRGNMDSYEAVKTELADIFLLKLAKIDFSQALELDESNDLIALKDFLANIVLCYHIEIQNLYLIRKTIDAIVEILRNRKRYKDALAYEEKYRKVEFKLQTTKEVEC